ncbi:MAG: hypothetical protein ACD_67C00250G0001 [uncultured bacterium]|nr:MAG: hypothetical protein ACD_67C00250G0001 [uncultured bacterium]
MHQKIFALDFSDKRTNYNYFHLQILLVDDLEHFPDNISAFDAVYASHYSNRKKFFSCFLFKFQGPYVIHLMRNDLYFHLLDIRICPQDNFF